MLIHHAAYAAGCPESGGAFDTIAGDDDFAAAVAFADAFARRATICPACRRAAMPGAAITSPPDLETAVTSVIRRAAANGDDAGAVARRMVTATLAGLAAAYPPAAWTDIVAAATADALTIADAETDWRAARIEDDAVITSPLDDLYQAGYTHGYTAGYITARCPACPPAPDDDPPLVLDDLPY